MSALRVENAGKVYRMYGSGLRRVLSWFGIGRGGYTDVRVLEGVNFSMDAGEAVGIAGHNGAGKSTLLKMIAGMTRPTEGTVIYSGTVSAIIELGLGFQPELTGRQNAVQYLGMSGFQPESIKEGVGFVEEFSELGGYFDKPVRIYSSGMQARLAFAAATAFRPDILIVDEALSVGDAYFQHKSFGRIREFLSSGTAVLLVSHDRQAMQSICDRVLLLDGGRQVMDGNPSEVLDYYNGLMAKRSGTAVSRTEVTGGRMQTVSGTGEAKCVSTGMYDADGNQVAILHVGREYELRVWVEVVADISDLVFGYMLKDRLGQTVYGTNTWFTGQVIKAEAGTKLTFRVRFRADLGVGSYSVSTALSGGMTHLEYNYEWRDFAMMFETVNTEKTHFEGHSYVPSVIEIEYE
ncbi:ABC transporter ATP-binding protein [Seleniivibrio woodruffii]|uniref:ABC transporter ATP-binding protein n=1 Tax=Seleniivibrio woodruffii TaxID=1078050 RepID=UPI0026F053B1|nr:ABC transporter ATP-binding protein [Seleniivibrio woodruffii]